MAAHFALLIAPIPADDVRDDYMSTFAPVDPSAPALSVGELRAGADGSTGAKVLM